MLPLSYRTLCNRQSHEYLAYSFGDLNLCEIDQINKSISEANFSKIITILFIFVISLKYAYNGKRDIITNLF